MLYSGARYYIGRFPNGRGVAEAVGGGDWLPIVGVAGQPEISTWFVTAPPASCCATVAVTDCTQLADNLYV